MHESKNLADEVVTHFSNTCFSISAEHFLALRYYVTFLNLGLEIII